MGLDGDEEVENHEVLRFVELVGVDALGVGGGVEAHELEEGGTFVGGGGGFGGGGGLLQGFGGGSGGDGGRGFDLVELGSAAHRIDG